MSMLDFQLAAAQAIPVTRTDPDMFGNQADQILKNPHGQLLSDLLTSL
jgi:hypothetical protein